MHRDEVQKSASRDQSSDSFRYLNFYLELTDLARLTRQQAPEMLVSVSTSAVL